MRNHLCENVFPQQIYFQTNQTHFHIKRFETEAQGNSKMALVLPRLDRGALGVADLLHANPAFPFSRLFSNEMQRAESGDEAD